MSWQVSILVTRFTKFAALALIVMIVVPQAMAQWRIDFSRRMKPKQADTNDVALDTPTVETLDVSDKDTPRKIPTQLPPKKITASEAQDIYPEPPTALTSRAVAKIKDAPVSMGDVQDIVILNTERGFVPSAIRLKQGSQYRLFVVNINEKEKNVSFVMDAFAEHHSTFFGQAKVISVIPQRDGVFQFQCPETAMEGRLVVLPSNTPAADTATRSPAQGEGW